MFERLPPARRETGTFSDARSAILADHAAGNINLPNWVGFLANGLRTAIFKAFPSTKWGQRKLNVAQLVSFSLHH
jgi:hypothetical protein